jgi:hypothetical protein
MLQSEDWQLRHEALQMIQKQTGHGIIDPSVAAIANPVAAALPATPAQTEEADDDAGGE